MVSAAGGAPQTEARETSAMSNTRSVPACRLPFLSSVCVKLNAIGHAWSRARAS